MALSRRTKLRITYSVLSGTGFVDAMAGRLLRQPLKGAGRRIQFQRDSRDIGTPIRQWHDLCGALHIHSTYSDGTGTVTEIMEAAREAGVDFVLLTDHNTLAPRQDGWEARFETRPLLLVGTEISLSDRAYLLALDMPPDWQPKNLLGPRVALDEINSRGGLAFVSMPLDFVHGWTDWNAVGHSGLEIMNFSTIVRRQINIPSLFWLALRFMRRGMADALKALVTRPDKELALWDRLTARGDAVVGVASLDAHQKIRIHKTKYAVPSYADLMRIATTHLLVPSGCAVNRRPAIYEALRAGRCYMSYDCLADPKGFRFVGATQGNEVVMGEQVAGKGGVLLNADLIGTKDGPAQTLLRLIHAGRIVAASDTGQLWYWAREAGGYRVEAYRYIRRIGSIFLGTRPWIFSNPIYIQ